MEFPGTIKLGSNNIEAIIFIREKIGFSLTFDTELQEKVKEYQRSKGLLDDGVVGPLTWQKLNEVEEIEKVSLDRIEKLHPKIIPIVKKAFLEAQSKLTGKAKLRISQGLRTYGEQNELYAQGRTKPGSIVTNAKAGYSFHNFAIAVDIVLIVDGKEASWDISKDWDGDKIADWMEVVEVFKKHGFVWGGNFSSLKDYPHFEMSFGYTLVQLRTKYNNKDFIKGTQYLNL